MPDGSRRSRSRCRARPRCSRASTTRWRSSGRASGPFDIRHVDVADLPRGRRATAWRTRRSGCGRSARCPTTRTCTAPRSPTRATTRSSSRSCAGTASRGPPRAQGREPRPRDVVAPAGRVDEWLLYVQESPSASGGRGLSLGRIYTRDGMLVASVAQEGMMRVPHSDDRLPRSVDRIDAGFVSGGRRRSGRRGRAPRPCARASLMRCGCAGRRVDHARASRPPARRARSGPLDSSARLSRPRSRPRGSRRRAGRSTAGCRAAAAGTGSAARYSTSWRAISEIVGEPGRPSRTARRSGRRRGGRRSPRTPGCAPPRAA